ncbi:SANT/Myb domain [Sesbania bispinosa]|nr:SANT/Myb domain [Sesbania bispinosa]
MDEKAEKKRSKIDRSNLASGFHMDSNKGKKKKHKDRKTKHATDKILNSNETLEENCTGEAADKQSCSIEVMDSNVADGKELQFLDENQQLKMKKRKKYDDSLTGKQKLGFSIPSEKGKMTKDNNEFKSNGGGDDDQGKKKKKKLSEGGKHKEYNEFKSNEGEDDDQGKKMKKEKKLIRESKLKKYNEFRNDECEDGDQGKKMKKKLSDESKSKENSVFNRNGDDPPFARVEPGDANARSVVTEVNDQGKEMKKEKTTKAGTGESPNPARDGTSKPKRVTFSDQVDVCCDGLVRGKRFTREEDEKIKAAVIDYIEFHGLGDEGLDMVLHCKKHPEVRDCWKEIGEALPNRPQVSVYYRAHILFERDERRKWTRDELEFVQKVQEQHGSDWKLVAEALDKSRVHVKDAWRRIKLTNIKRGRWTQEEIQNLFDLVNLDLCARASEGYRKSKHGMLRDNISWEAIGSKLATRTSQVCCKKWYEKLAPPMVSKGEWSDTDDYRLVTALYVLDACCMEEVDWESLLEHRSGDICRKRWNQMVQQIGEYGGKPFAEQVEILSKRYSPDLLEAREAFDNKPVVC